MSNKGFLGIWCEIGQDDLQDYRNWITREHIADRIFSPGFLGVRFCSALDNECAHFFLYITESSEVLRSPSYLHIVDNPSAWTKKIMPKFGPFDRAAGEQILKLGNGFGPYMVVSRIKMESAVALDIESIKAKLGAFMDMPDIVSVRLMAVDRSVTDVKNNEKTMRVGGEGNFQYLLVLESMSEAGATNTANGFDSRIKKIFPESLRSDFSIRKILYGEAPYEGITG